MTNTLNRNDAHVLLEQYDNTKNSFIANVNELVNKLDTVVEANRIFDKSTLPTLQELASLDLRAVTADLKKSSYLGSRKLDINLALNIDGIDEKLFETDFEAVEALWNDPYKIVRYNKAVVTFTDGTVVELPFVHDDNPVTISAHSELLQQLSRYENKEAKKQKDRLYQIIVLDGALYTVIINNIPITYTSEQNNATLKQIVAGLTSAINTADVDVEAVDKNTFIELIAKEAGNPFIATSNNNMRVVNTTPNIIEGLGANEFLLKMENTLLSGFAYPVIGEFVRFYDIVGNTSNLENIQLHAVSGDYKDQYPTYYWSKTTSALQTLSMRVGDIIRLGAEVDNIAALTRNIQQLLVIQERIPELVDTYTNNIPNGDITIYNNLSFLMEIYEQLNKIVDVYKDIREGGPNYVIDVGTDLQDIDSFIKTVGTDLQELTSKIKEVGSDLQNAESNIRAVGSDLYDVNSKIKAVGEDLIDADSFITAVATDLQNDNTIGTTALNINSVSAVAVNIQDVGIVSNDINAVKTNAASINSINNAAANAAAAATQAGLAESYAGIAEQQAIIAKNQADAATAKSNEIKNVSVGSVYTLDSNQGANVVYNSTTGKFSFSIPKGIKGDKGNSFTPTVIGLLADKSSYNNKPEGFSYLAYDTSSIYFKTGDGANDWSEPALFGKGEKGDIGVSIVSVQFKETTDNSNEAGKLGAVDTYEIVFSDNTTTTFNVTNGTATGDATELVAGKVVKASTDDMTLGTNDSKYVTPLKAITAITNWWNSLLGNNINIHSGNLQHSTGYTTTAPMTQKAVTEVLEALESDLTTHTDKKDNPHAVTKIQVGLSNVDNTSDANKPISTATQTALNGKVNNDDIRLTDAREWAANTVPEEEAEDGVATTRRAWTSQRVRQAITGWWNNVGTAFGKGFVDLVDAAAGRSKLGLGTAATGNIVQSTGTSETDLMSQKAVTNGLNSKLSGVLSQSLGFNADFVVSQRALTQHLGQFPLTDYFGGAVSATNKLTVAGMLIHLGIQVGDVIRVECPGLNYNKLHTVDIITNDNTITVNQAHSGNMGNGSLKLPDVTSAPITITLIAKWYNASPGLGRRWVDCTGIRTTSTEYVNIQRDLLVSYEASEVPAGSYTYGYEVGIYENDLLVYAKTIVPGEGRHMFTAFISSGSHYRVMLTHMGFPFVNPQDKWYELR